MEEEDEPKSWVPSMLVIDKRKMKDKGKDTPERSISTPVIISFEQCKTLEKLLSNIDPQ